MLTLDGELLQDLRLQLEHLSESRSGFVSSQPYRLAALQRQWPHSIEVHESPYPLHEYNCFMFALGLAGNERYLKRQGKREIHLAGSEFARWLIDSGLLTELRDYETEIAPQGIGFYFDATGKCTHAGLALSNGRMLSKWGTGQLLEHGYVETPLSYGNILRFFEGVSIDRSFEYLERFDHRQAG